MDVWNLEKRVLAGIGSTDEQAVAAASDAAAHLRARCEAAESGYQRLVRENARADAAALLHQFDGFQRAVRAVIAIIEARSKTESSPARANEAREILDELWSLIRR